MSDIKAKQRFLFLDIIKVIALLFMPCIHIFEVISGFEFGSDLYPVTSLETQFGFIYLIVPTVFLFSMGASLNLARNQTPKDFLKRGIHLLLVGLLLNVLRGSIYMLLGLIYHDSSLYLEYWYWLWGSDILYFDGLFFILFALFRKLHFKDWHIALMSVAMIGLSQLITPVAVENQTLIEIIGNFAYVDYDSCFPVLSWTIYPISGYLFMKGIINAKNREKFVSLFGVSSLIVFAVSFGIMKITNTFDIRYLLWGECDFIMDAPSILLTLPIVGVYVSIMYFVSRLIKCERFSTFISKISSNLNSTYVIHWVIVMYLAFFWIVFGEDITINYGFTTYLIGFAVIVVSAVFAELYKRQKNKRKIAK